MSFTLPTYTWKGRIYKSLRGLHKAVLKDYPHCSVCFEEHDMVLSFHLMSGNRGYIFFKRTFLPDGNSFIAATYHKTAETNVHKGL